MNEIINILSTRNCTYVIKSDDCITIAGLLDEQDININIYNAHAYFQITIENYLSIDLIEGQSLDKEFIYDIVNSFLVLLQENRLTVEQYHFLGANAYWLQINDPEQNAIFTHLNNESIGGTIIRRLGKRLSSSRLVTKTQ